MASSPITLWFQEQQDPSSADTQAGFRHSIDLNNDGDFSDPGEVEDVSASAISRVFSESGWHTVRARIKGKDGGFSDVWIDVFVEDPLYILMVSASEGKELLFPGCGRNIIKDSSQEARI